MQTFYYDNFVCGVFLFFEQLLAFICFCTQQSISETLRLCEINGALNFRAIKTLVSPIETTKNTATATTTTKAKLRQNQNKNLAQARTSKYVHRNNFDFNIKAGNENQSEVN